MLSVVGADYKGLFSGVWASFICQAFDVLRPGGVSSVRAAYRRLSLEYVCAPGHVRRHFLILLLLLLLLEAGREEVAKGHVCSSGAFLDFEAILLMLLLA